MPSAPGYMSPMPSVEADGPGTQEDSGPHRDALNDARRLLVVSLSSRLTPSAVEREGREVFTRLPHVGSGEDWRKRNVTHNGASRSILQPGVGRMRTASAAGSAAAADGRDALMGGVARARARRTCECANHSTPEHV